MAYSIIAGGNTIAFADFDGDKLSDFNFRVIGARNLTAGDFIL